MKANSLCPLNKKKISHHWVKQQMKHLIPASLTLFSSLFCLEGWISYYSSKKKKEDGLLSPLTKELITYIQCTVSIIYLREYHYKPCEYFSSLLQFNHCTCCG